jgi:aspartate kinase
VTAIYKSREEPIPGVSSRAIVDAAAALGCRQAAYVDRKEDVPAMLAPRLKRGDAVVVMGGFIGATECGVTTTLGRGGSDFSAAIVGAGIGAGEIEIWTDVDGMMTADPNSVPGAHRLKVISFTEAAELAYFGAKVLHPATLVPAIDKNIPVQVLNSRNPKNEGTRITARAPSRTNTFKAIAAKKRITIVDVAAPRMLLAHGFLRNIFEAFDRHKVSVDVVST